MKYTLANGKNINIPDDEIQANMDHLHIDRLEAVQVWLEDNEYEMNEEQEKLDTEAKGKVNPVETREKRGRKKGTPRTVHTSDEKKELFNTILTNLTRAEGVEDENIEILKENKLIQVKMGAKTFKIDLIECRPPKN